MVQSYILGQAPVWRLENETQKKVLGCLKVLYLSLADEVQSQTA